MANVDANSSEPIFRYSAIDSILVHFSDKCAAIQFREHFFSAECG